MSTTIKDRRGLLRRLVAIYAISQRPMQSQAADGVHLEPGDGSDWRVSGGGEKPYLVRFPTAYDTQALRAALYARLPPAAAAWSRRCERCGGQKVPGSRCVGDDDCGEGDGGGPAECCADWGARCCRCGWSYGVSQL